jgi:ribonucleoside-triphosphate reductase
MQIRICQVRKRDGRMVAFDDSKIADAIFKAAQAVGGENRETANELAAAVTEFVNRNFQEAIPTIEDIQDMVEKVLIETNHAKTAKAYILYRDRRAQARRAMKVRKSGGGKSENSTDMALMVATGKRDQVLPWDMDRIAQALMVESGLDAESAHKIAKSVEERIFSSGINRVSTNLVRELVDNELFERGLTARLEKQKLLGMPKYDLERLIFSKSQENSNITANNPEAINLTIAENTLKQYALEEIFSKDVAEGHMAGRVHLHDLGYPTRVYCSSHSLEYLKKYGLDLGNLDTSSAPAKHARTLTGHLNTFLASMQAYYAGALGVGFINIFYAPYVEKMSDKELLQEAQHLIFSCSQSAFSRGGQTLFLDFNVHTGIPGYLKTVEAIGPSGRPVLDAAGQPRTYGSFEAAAQRFCKAMLDVWRGGDRDGHLFAFPKCDLHVTRESFSEPAQRELLDYACLIASENGVPYFVFDRPNANDKESVSLSACCRLRTTIEDEHMIRHPESMRFCGFQNITVNLPQAAYRGGQGNWDGFKREVFHAMDLALKAHLQKKEFIAKLMSGPSMPLWEIGKKAKDGRLYVDLEKCTYIIGLIGLNEALQFMTGHELHESDAVLMEGIKIVAQMKFRCDDYGRQHKLKFTLEESPAESASRRLAKIDYRDWPESRQYLRGDVALDEVYYTNSIHLRPDAPVDLMTRIEKQAKFHTLIESGAITHAFVGEERPPAESILALVRKTFENTRTAQLTISPEFTICNECNHWTPRLTESCEKCAGTDVYGVTRIVGYFSRINNWNKSKLGELKARHRGNYGVGHLFAKTPAAPAATPTSNVATAAAGS